MRLFRVLSEFADVELVRLTFRPLASIGENYLISTSSLFSDMTKLQLMALRRALASGYFDLPAGPVATVEFDPDRIADRVICHGFGSWLEWRKRYGKYERNGPTMEIYDGDTWASARAWKSLRIEVPLKKL